MAENALLSLGFEIPFDRITPADIEPAMAALISDAARSLEAIETAADPLGYDAVLGALDRATERLDVAMTVVGHLESVASTPDLRTAYNVVKPDVTAFYAGIPLRERLWSALRRYADTDEARGLQGAQRRFLEKTIDDFRRHGADLPPAGKRRLEELSRNLAELTSTFSQNVVDSTAAWDLFVDDEARLAGLPDSAKAQARAAAREKGREGFRFTLHAPSVIPVLTYLDDSEIREAVYRAFNARAASGGFDNAPVIRKIIELRREQAKLLGYSSFADLVLEDRMAKTAERARRFVDDLTKRTRPAFERDTAELLAFRRSVEGASAADLQPWDVGYWSEKRRRSLYDLDQEALRPYFSVDRVLDGIFETVHRLYGVRIEPNQTAPTWRSDVRAYDLREGPRLLGTFYVDLFPHDEKRGGAWMNGLVTGVARGEASTPHLALVCANLTPPLDGQPALLTHMEVTTLFHEFGHLMHHLLSRVEVRSLAGTNVAWDFVELPSQIMENWCWEREALDTFARHVETGDRIPDDLFQKMRSARNYREGSATMRQLGFSTVDFALHLDWNAERDPDLLAYARRTLQPYAATVLPDDYGMIASFGHLFSSSVGYASGYYSYKWAEVLDADAFTRFRREGVFNRDTGAAFRKTILERGDSDDPMALFRDFMGREPSLDALLERAGLADPKAA